MSFDKLTIGGSYSKADLSEIFENPNIKIIREGIYNLNATQSFFFVDLEKRGKEDRFHFDDFYEGDYFHWDSQTTQHLKTPKIQEIINGTRTPFLFARVNPKIKGKTQPFIYCGKLKFIEYVEGTSKPIHIIFQNLDFEDDTENKNLIDIYSWKPNSLVKYKELNISKSGVVSKERQKRYTKPNKTERTGLVTSRVGQGYFRQLVKDRWENRCPVTGSDVLKILISSHIVPWSECTDDERLDVDNGILLSPDVDALFDKHLISFSDEGELITSNAISKEELSKLGIRNDIIINVSVGMRKYLKRHREKMES